MKITNHAPKSSRRSTPDLGIRRILVPVDFSDAGRPALEQARILAQLTGSSVHLVHVIESIYLAAPPYGAELAYAQFDRTELREKITRSIGAIQTGILSGVATRFEIREGVAHREIVAAAKAAKIDLIVMGTHGHSGIERILLGSTAERVVRLAPCAVMVVRPGSSRPPRRTTRRRETALAS